MTWMVIHDLDDSGVARVTQEIPISEVLNFTTRSGAAPFLLRWPAVQPRAEVYSPRPVMCQIPIPRWLTEGNFIPPNICVQ